MMVNVDTLGTCIMESTSAQDRGQAPRGAPNLQRFLVMMKQNPS
jgi:hypothetical protein